MSGVRLASSIDRSFGSADLSEATQNIAANNYPLMSPPSRLKQNLKNRKLLFTLDLITLVSPTSSSPTTILNDDGSIDSNKFADSILRSSLSAFRMFGDEQWDSPKNLRELNAKYIQDKAPLLKMEQLILIISIGLIRCWLI